MGKKPAYEIYPETYFRLLELIHEYDKVADRLPSEEALAEQLGVSRIKIRDVLAEMETNGYVIRKRGVGTLINKYALAEKARIDLDNIFEDMIIDLGFRPSTLVKKIQHVSEYPQHVCDSLQLNQGDPVYKLEKVLSADDTPVIYLEDYIPAYYFNDRDIDVELLTVSTYAFLQHYSEHLLESLIAHLDAVVVDERLAEIMKVPTGTALLKLTSVCYSQLLKPMLVSVEYYNTRILPMSFSKRIIFSKQSMELRRTKNNE